MSASGRYYPLACLQPKAFVRRRLATTTSFFGGKNFFFKKEKQNETKQNWTFPTSFVTAAAALHSNDASPGTQADSFGGAKLILVCSTFFLSEDFKGIRDRQKDVASLTMFFFLYKEIPI